MSSARVLCVTMSTMSTLLRATPMAWHIVLSLKRSQWSPHLQGNRTSIQMVLARLPGSFYQPYAVSVSPSGTFALVADYQYSTIRHIDVDTRELTTLAGKTNQVAIATILDGVGSNAHFTKPRAVALPLVGGRTTAALVGFVVDFITGRLRRIDVSSRAVTTIAGERRRPGVGLVGLSQTFVLLLPT